MLYSHFLLARGLCLFMFSIAAGFVRGSSSTARFCEGGGFAAAARCCENDSCCWSTISEVLACGCTCERGTLNTHVFLNIAFIDIIGPASNTDSRALFHACCGAVQQVALERLSVVAYVFVHVV